MNVILMARLSEVTTYSANNAIRGLAFLKKEELSIKIPATHATIEKEVFDEVFDEVFVESPADTFSYLNSFLVAAACFLFKQYNCNIKA